MLQLLQDRLWRDLNGAREGDLLLSGEEEGEDLWALVHALPITSDFNLNMD